MKKLNLLLAGISLCVVGTSAVALSNDPNLYLGSNTPNGAVLVKPNYFKVGYPNSNQTNFVIPARIDCTGQNHGFDSCWLYRFHEQMGKDILSDWESAVKTKAFPPGIEKLLDAPKLYEGNVYSNCASHITQTGPNVSTDSDLVISCFVKMPSK